MPGPSAGHGDLQGVSVLTMTFNISSKRRTVHCHFMHLAIGDQMLIAETKRRVPER